MNVRSPQEVVSIDVDRLESQSCTSPEILPQSFDNERIEPVTHLNDALLAQLDLPKMESFWFTAEDGTKLQGLHHSAAGVRCCEEVSA